MELGVVQKGYVGEDYAFSRRTVTENVLEEFSYREGNSMGEESEIMKHFGGN